MPSSNRKLTRAARERATQAGVTYTAARSDLLWMRELIDDGMDPVEAAAYVDNPGNKTMCTDCGWTYGMTCPECPGCGCYNGRCSGWRHAEYEDDDREPYDCGCGASHEYECVC